jgi:arabinan endo-1,5-alpha-L-arabinosidase
VNNNCQKYKVERLGDGSHIMTPLSGARIVTVAGSSTTAGTRLSLQDYSDCNCQKWLIAAQTAREAVSPEPVVAEERLRIIYPNPVIKEQQLTVVIGSPGKYVVTRIFTSDGKLVYSNKQLATNNLQIPAPQKAGVYLVQVTSEEGIIREKLVVR